MVSAAFVLYYSRDKTVRGISPRLPVHSQMYLILIRTLQIRLRMSQPQCRQSLRGPSPYMEWCLSRTFHIEHSIKKCLLQKSRHHKNAHLHVSDRNQLSSEVSPQIISRFPDLQIVAHSLILLIPTVQWILKGHSLLTVTGSLRTFT